MADHVTSSDQVLSKPRAAFPESNGLSKASATLQRSLRLGRLGEFVLQPQILLLTIVAIVAGRDLNRGEFFFYGDAMRHAMNGAFFRDFLLDLPLRHPLQYVYEYYAKYPALAFPHWPPLFHFIEGVFFLLFGLSPWVSGMVVLGFALLGIYYWYRIAERLGPRHRAFLSALILACLPFVLVYERVTMLEIPALALCLGAIHFWLRFQETERHGDLLALTGFVVAAFLTSQKAIFLALFIVVDLVVERRWRLLKRWDVWLALLVSLVAVIPWYLLAARTMTFWSARLIGLTGKQGHYLLTSRNYLFYLPKLYAQMGPVLIGLACVGLLIAILRPTRSNRFWLVWVLSGYLCFTLVREKDPRHSMLLIPPLIYLAVVALETICVRRAIALTASSVLALVYLVNGLRTERPSVTGAREVAQYALSLPESDIVYFQGQLDGDFIFFVRKFDPQKEHMVARDKQIVVTRLGMDPKAILQTREQILGFFQTWGIRYAVVEDEDPFRQFAVVRELLHSDQFELLRTFPVQSNQPNYPVHEFQVYRFRGELHRTTQPVTLPMMTINHPITVDLSRLVGHPWPN